MQEKINHYLNVKFDLKVDGNEIKLDLNGKNIGNIGFMLLTLIEFENLEEVVLSNNNISDINPIENFKAPKLKKLDLSFNTINDLTPMAKFLNSGKKIEEINFKNNLIQNVDVLKKNITSFIKKINLDGNKIIKKDLDEIKFLINQNMADANKINTLKKEYSISFKDI